MFHLEESEFGPYRRYRFQHFELGHGFDIVPEVAANVTEIRFSGRNILDGYTTPEELTAGKWGKSAILFPFPNRLRDGRYTWKGRDYVFPINNLATNNAIHGFVRHEVLQVERIELKKEMASITSRFHNDGKNPAYPFPFTFDATFAMTIQGRFIVSFSVTNEHHESIPVGLGWHPYFHLAEKADAHHLQLPACERVEIDDRMIPTGIRSPYSYFQDERWIGQTQLDTCFAVAGESTQTSTLCADGRTLRIRASGKQFPFFQVFTPPARTSIAIEPMTCNVDAFHNGDGLVELAPAQPWAVSFEIEYDDTAH